MYRIKFLEEATHDDIGNERKKFINPVYSDSEIKNLAKNWKRLGLLKIVEIRIEKGAKLDHEGLINLLYDDKKIKAQEDGFTQMDAESKRFLLDTYCRKDEKIIEKERRKERRKELFEKIEKHGVSMPKNASTDVLAEKLKKLES